MRHGIILYQICVIILQSHAFTHWIVTENGRIEPKLDTHFAMRRPYDLIALLDQEKRCNEMNALIKEMSEQHNRIDSNSRFFLDYYHEDCLHESKDIPSTIASNGSNRVAYFLHEPQPHQALDVRCTRFSSLPFSMRSFDHLPSINARNESTNETCGDCFPDMHWDAVSSTIAMELSRNASSWIHYNLAFIYWWKVGNIREAIDCARLALHYAPTEYYDIPLANLANLFHLHPDKLSDAITLTKAAIHHAPKEAKYYLLLGKAYVKNSEFEKGARCFEKYQRLEMQDKGSTESMETISCFLKTLLDLKDHSDLLQGILLNLHDFHSKQQRWLSLQERILWEGAPNEHRMSEALEDQVVYLHNVRVYKTIRKDIEWMLRNSKKEQSERKRSFTPSPELQSQDHPVEILAEKYPPLMNIGNNLYFDAPTWPTNEECVAWSLPLDERENLNLSIFMPLENKGFQITKLLTKDIEIEESEEHSLPWYPPHCETVDYVTLERGFSDEIKSMLEKNKPLPSHQILNAHFLNYINHGNSNAAEIGQRIVTAMSQKKAPAWLLALLAHMYWRIRRNPKNAMHCLAIDTPKVYSDVRFIALASMMYEMDFLDDALTYATFASRQNLNEPSTNLLLALIHYKKQNPIKAMFHLKNVLRIESEYYDGEAERLLKLWACRIKLGEYEFYQKSEEKPNNVCPQTLPIVCSANSDKCKTAAIQYVRSAKYKNTPSSYETLQFGSHIVPASLISSILQVIQSRIIYNEENQFYIQKIEQNENELGEFYVSFSDDSTQEVPLKVYDQSVINVLTRKKCNIINDFAWWESPTIWKAFASRNLNFEELIDKRQAGLQKTIPKCIKTSSTSTHAWDRFTKLILSRPFHLDPGFPISEWLSHILEQQDSNLSELAHRIASALNKNNTSWMLASAAALYWHSVGNLQESVTCIRHALTLVPPEMKDIPLLHLANVLLSIGLHHESLEVIEMAIKINPKFAIHYFSAGYNYAALGDFEKAAIMYRCALAVDVNFEPATNRLMAILCLLLFDESIIDS